MSDDQDICYQMHVLTKHHMWTYTARYELVDYSNSKDLQYCPCVLFIGILCIVAVGANYPA